MDSDVEKSLGKPSQFISLTYRDFRLFLFGLFISLAGSQMQIVALNWHIYLLTHSALALGLIGLMRFIPITIFSLIGGSFADTHNRKTILLIAETILGIIALVLALFTFS